MSKIDPLALDRAIVNSYTVGVNGLKSIGMTVFALEKTVLLETLIIIVLIITCCIKKL